MNPVPCGWFPNIDDQNHETDLLDLAHKRIPDLACSPKEVFMQEMTLIFMSRGLRTIFQVRSYARALMAQMCWRKKTLGFDKGFDDGWVNE
jgi:hypothetical protein